MYGRGGGREERERERGTERESERERTSGLLQCVRGFHVFFILILFHVMGLVLQRRNGTAKNTLLLLLSLFSLPCSQKS